MDPVESHVSGTFLPRSPFRTAVKLHQRDDRSFVIVVRDAASITELARALIGGGDRVILEEPYLSCVLPGARIAFDSRIRYDRFKQLVLVRVFLRLTGFVCLKPRQCAPGRTLNAYSAFVNYKRLWSATLIFERRSCPSAILMWAVLW